MLQNRNLGATVRGLLVTLETRDIQLHLGMDNTEACKASGRGRLACEAQPDTHKAGGGCPDAWRVGADRKGDPVNSGQPRLSGLLLSDKLKLFDC